MARTFSDMVKARMTLEGYTIQQVAKKMRISRNTLGKHLATGKITRNELIQLHKLFKFSDEELRIYAEGK